MQLNQHVSHILHCIWHNIHQNSGHASVTCTSRIRVTRKAIWPYLASSRTTCGKIGTSSAIRVWGCTHIFKSASRQAAPVWLGGKACTLRESACQWPVVARVSLVALAVVVACCLSEWWYLRLPTCDERANDELASTRGGGGVIGVIWL